MKNIFIYVGLLVILSSAMLRAAEMDVDDNTETTEELTTEEEKLLPKLDIGVASKTGARHQQSEDTYVNRDISSSFNNNKFTRFFGVFDGHGGKEVSGFLAEEMSRFVIAKLGSKQDLTSPKKLFRDVFKLADNSVSTKFDQGSCATTALVVENYIILANAGDSRAFVNFNDDNAVVTRDHKPNFKEEKSRIKKAKGFVRKKEHDVPRVGGILAVSRAIGDYRSQTSRKLTGVTYKPDVYVINMDKTVTSLVIASDGLWDVMTTEEVMEVVNTSLSGEVTADALAKEAQVRGSKDDITVIVVKFKWDT